MCCTLLTRTARTARITMAEPSEPTWFEDMTKRVREVQRDEAGNLTTESYLHVCEGNLKIFTIIFNGYAGAPALPWPLSRTQAAGWPRVAGRGWLEKRAWHDLALQASGELAALTPPSPGT